VRVRFIRHATLVFEAGGVSVLVDPMLGPAGAAEPVANTPNGRRNPLVDLPFGDEELGGELGCEGLLGRVEIPADGETLKVP
jgi:L-ascorbate metabolism protein UlaG (beta-lactamase superfamily)